jgi:hypothetical protein
MPGKVYSEPSSVEAVEGAVAVDGPDGVSISMTPQAALTTSDRLLDGAMVAQGQRRRPGAMKSGAARRVRRQNAGSGLQDRTSGDDPGPTAHRWSVRLLDVHFARG